MNAMTPATFLDDADLADRDRRPIPDEVRVDSDGNVNAYIAAAHDATPAYWRATQADVAAARNLGHGMSFVTYDEGRAVLTDDAAAALRRDDVAQGRFAPAHLPTYGRKPSDFDDVPQRVTPRQDGIADGQDTRPAAVRQAVHGVAAMMGGATADEAVAQTIGDLPSAGGPDEAAMLADAVERQQARGLGGDAVATGKHDDLLRANGLEFLAGQVRAPAQATASIPLEVMDVVVETCESEIRRLRLAPDADPARVQSLETDVRVLKAVRHLRRELHKIATSAQARSAIVGR